MWLTRGSPSPPWNAWQAQASQVGSEVIALIHSFPGISGFQHIFPNSIPLEPSGRSLEKHPNLQGTVNCSTAPGPTNYCGGVHPGTTDTGTLVAELLLLFHTFSLEGREKKNNSI